MLIDSVTAKRALDQFENVIGPPGEVAFADETPESGESSQPECNHLLAGFGDSAGVQNAQGFTFVVTVDGDTCWLKRFTLKFESTDACAVAAMLSLTTAAVTGEYEPARLVYQSLSGPKALADGALLSERRTAPTGQSLAE